LREQEQASSSSSSSGSSTNPPPGTWAYNGAWQANKTTILPLTQSFAGTYKGSHDSNDLSVITLICCDDSQVFFLDEYQGKPNYGRGSLNVNGSFIGNTFDTNGTLGSFNGTVNGSMVSGSWMYGGYQGTFQATLAAANPNLPVTPGTYTGTVSGDLSGDLNMGIGSDGSMVGITHITSKGQAGIATTIDNNGTVSAYIDSSVLTGIYEGTAYGTTASGTWSANNR
jgi:hypothetical protein